MISECLQLSVVFFPHNVLIARQDKAGRESGEFAAGFDGLTIELLGGPNGRTDRQGLGRPSGTCPDFITQDLLVLHCPFCGDPEHCPGEIVTRMPGFESFVRFQSGFGRYSGLCFHEKQGRSSPP